MMVSKHDKMCLNVCQHWVWSGLLLTSASTDDYDCYSYAPSAYTGYSNGSYTETRYAQLCINNTYHTVCTAGLDEADVQLLCTNRGAQYGFLVQSQDIQDRLYPPITQTGITNINCSEGYGCFNPYYCSYRVSYDYCNTNGGPALIACVFVGKINHTHSYMCLCTCMYMLTQLQAYHFCQT